ncbi:MAG: hypothetical protein RLN86_02765 [Cyclobacteriaceae bacterium]
MKTLLSLLFITAATLCCRAQENFVAGYVINSDGQKIEGSIDDQYWTNSPSIIQFKDAAGVLGSYTPGDLQEFGVGEKTIYKSFLVKYDSSASLKELSRQFQPELKESQVFLKAVLLSNLSLFQYQENWVTHFFLVKDGQAEALINHEFYQVTDGIETKRVNQSYIEQLRRYFSDCEDVKIDRGVSYNEKGLRKVFQAYGDCRGVAATTFTDLKPIKTFGVVGLFGLDKSGGGFKGDIGYGGGLFLNFALPNKLYKNSLLVELGYRQFGTLEHTRQSSVSALSSSGTTIESLSFNAISLTMAARKRISKSLVRPIFLQSGINFMYGLDGEYSITGASGGKTIRGTKPESTLGLFLGGGVLLTPKFTLDMRYQFGSAINYKDSEFLTSSTNYSTINLSIAYNLLK